MPSPIQSEVAPRAMPSPIQPMEAPIVMPSDPLSCSSTAELTSLNMESTNDTNSEYLNQALPIQSSPSATTSTPKELVDANKKPVDMEQASRIKTM